MTFYGQEDKHEDHEAPPKQRSYSVFLADGKKATVEADFISRDPGYICFWKSTKGNLQDILVLAISNRLLDELKEVTE